MIAAQTARVQMALSAKLTMRQGQTMVLTPQLLQAIKLLQMPNVELSAFIENELTSNPLLERAEDQEGREADRLEGRPEAPAAEASAEPGDWASDSLETSSAAMEANLGTEVENAFDGERTAPSAQVGPGEGLPTGSWGGAGGGGSVSGEAPDLEAYVSETISLHDHLERQAGVILVDPTERMIGRALIDGVDEAGYLIGALDEIAERLGTTPDAVEAVLIKMHTLEPTGVFARNLAECLALQLRERDRFDPAMQAMIANLPALARRDFPLLRKVCGVDDEDLADMIAEIKRLEPKPGRAFGDPVGAPAIPDVYVVAAPDRTWRVELNSRGAAAGAGQ